MTISFGEKAGIPVNPFAYSGSISVFMNLSSQMPRKIARHKLVRMKYIDPYSAGVVPIAQVIMVVETKPKPREMAASNSRLSCMIISLQIT
jgi:hypothetical protein